jgi:DNA-binding LacI/PurR family transcriptional regulator
VQPGKAYAAARDILQAGDLPEAFFVDTDYKAMEVVCALNDAGVRVPGQVRIAAYDNVPEAATFTPALTTVSIPRREIGRRAAQMLLEWPEDGAMPESVLLTSELIVRDSSGAPKEPVDR